MATRVELSVGGTTDVPSLADQIKRFQPRVFNSTESTSRIFDRSAKVGHRVAFFLDRLLLVKMLVCVTKITSCKHDIISYHSIIHEIHQVPRFATDG